MKRLGYPAPSRFPCWVSENGKSKLVTFEVEAAPRGAKPAASRKAPEEAGGTAPKKRARVVGIGASAGVALLAPGYTPANVNLRADLAMYARKRIGRVAAG